MSGTTLQIKFNITTIVIIILLLLGIVGGIYLYQNKVNNLKNKLDTEIKLKNALLDTVTVYQNKQGEWVAQKLTLQETLSNLNKINSQLTTEQKTLLAKIAAANKQNTVIAAALIASNIRIDSLLSHSATIDTVNKSLAFRDSVLNAKKETIFKYDITIRKAIPAFANIKPTLMFNKISLPNTQYIEFFWKNDKKTNYPIAFSVTNSNEYFKTTNIDSYIIPQVDKSTLKPTFWDNLGTFFKSTGGKVLFFGIGGGAGILVGHYIWK